MALTPPTVEDLVAHAHVSDVTELTEEEAYAVDALQHATDLMQVATGVSEDPEDAMALRILRRGILEMALAILVRAPDREALYSPFSSERIGSYSYQKAQQAVQEQAGTGVGDFDFAVAYFQGLAEAEGLGEVWHSGETVFERKPYYPELKTAADYPDGVLLPDPSEA